MFKKKNSKKICLKLEFDNKSKQLCLIIYKQKQIRNNIKLVTMIYYFDLNLSSLSFKTKRTKG